MKRIPRGADAHLTARRVTALALMALLAMRLAAAAFIAPPVVADAQGYEAAAYRLAVNGTYSYPGEEYWTRTEDDELIITEGDRRSFLSAPRSAFPMPGYPLFRSIFFRLSRDLARVRLLTRLAQALLSMMSAIIVWAIARRFSARAGKIALLASAAYVPFTLADSYLLTETLFAALLVSFLALYLLWTDRRDARVAALAAFVLGLATWVRPPFAPWLLVAAVLTMLSSRTRSLRDARHLALMGIVLVLTISPWWVRNASLNDISSPLVVSVQSTALDAIRVDVGEQMPFPWSAEAPRQTSEEQEIEARIDSFFAKTRSMGDEQRADYFEEEGASLTRDLYEHHWLTLASDRLRSVSVSLVTPFAISRTPLQGLPFLVGWLSHVAILGFFVAGAVTLPKRLDARLLASLPIYSILVYLPTVQLNRYHFPVMTAVIVIGSIGLDRLWARRSALPR